MFRYTKLGYVALSVTNLEVSTRFYVDMLGLQLVQQNEDVSFLRCSQDHHNIILYQAKKPGLKRIGFELEYPEMVNQAFEYFSEKGLNPQYVDDDECHRLAQGKTFRLREPNSRLLLEYYSGITQMALNYKHTVTKIALLGHVVLKVSNFEKTLKMFTETLNFRTSDYVGNGFAFLRCFPNPYHHSIGLGQYDRNQLHHVNFMVSDIDDIGIARNRFTENNVPIVYGPGRHAPSGSIFLYFLDPDGITLEYSYGMEEFPEERARKARILERNPVTLDLWGGKPLPGYTSIGEIE